MYYKLGLVLGRYLYSVPFIPSSPAALVLYILLSVKMIDIYVMVKGSGSIVEGVPIYSYGRMLVLGGGNNS